MTDDKAYLSVLELLINKAQLKVDKDKRINAKVWSEVLAKKLGMRVYDQWLYRLEGDSRASSGSKSAVYLFFYVCKALALH